VAATMARQDDQTTAAEFEAERARMADFARALEDYIRTPADDYLEQNGGGGGGDTVDANEVGRCTLNQVDPWPITFSLSNP
jgi:hypothetical protein